MSGEDDPRLAPYDYDLPDSLIARYPPPERDGGRLLDLRADAPADRHIPDLPDLLAPGDLLVLNDAQVLAARVLTRRASGGAVEALFLSHVPDAQGFVPAMLGPSRRLKAGEVLSVEGQPQLTLRLGEKLEDGAWQVAAHPSPEAVMAAAGALPLPPYLRRDAEGLDAARYQTVFAATPGAVAAPTAGLHLTPALLDAIAARGVEVVRLTLLVGAGTFRNLRPTDLDRGELHAEKYVLSPAVAEAVARTRARGGRVTAVGTTSTRCLESAAVGDGSGLVAAGAGETRLFIQPGYRFQVVDRLLTNFHLPKSSLLMLVCALGGQERVLAAYRHAIAAGYRFYSYGDAMLLEPTAAQARVQGRGGA